MCIYIYIYTYVCMYIYIYIYRKRVAAQILQKLGESVRVLCFWTIRERLFFAM